MKEKVIKRKNKLEIYTIEDSHNVTPPLFFPGVSAGFPSPADDYTELKLDMNKYLVKHSSATFYIKVKGDSMKDAGISDGDILVVDRAVEPKNNDIAVCVIDGEFTVKKLKKSKDTLFLLPENPDYKPINVTEYNNFQVWGMVTFIVHKT